MRKTAKILCTALPVISAAGAAAGLYKLAGYFFNYCLVRTNPGYKAAQNKAHENLSPKQAAEDFFQEEHTKWFDSQHPQTVHIVSEDSLKLSAYYIPAPKPTKNFLLAIHGYRCNGREEYAIFSPFYHNDMNFNLLIPDDRAHGRSENISASDVWTAKTALHGAGISQRLSEMTVVFFFTAFPWAPARF